jgi:hypothetical protein
MTRESKIDDAIHAAEAHLAAQDALLPHVVIVEDPQTEDPLCLGPFPQKAEALQYIIGWLSDQNHDAFNDCTLTAHPLVEP